MSGARTAVPAAGRVDALSAESGEAARPLVSVVMPCLNEEAAIGPCIEKIRQTFDQAGIEGEIVVCDNGSTDASVAIAERMGARVVRQPPPRIATPTARLRQRARPVLRDGRRGRHLRLHMIPQFLAALEWNTSS
jgi:glycosyltransferase involved in cell wall biosynthesis